MNGSQPEARLFVLYNSVSLQVLNSSVEWNLPSDQHRFHYCQVAASQKNMRGTNSEKKTRSEIFPDSEIGLGFGLNRGRNISVGNWWRHSCSFCPLTMLSCAHRPTALLRYVLLNRCVIVILTQQIRRFQSHKNTIWTSDLSATGRSYKPLEFQLWDPKCLTKFCFVAGNH